MVLWGIKLTELSFPVCPICKREVLLPFSTMQFGVKSVSDKTFGSWVCSNCGFYLSTKDNKASNPDQDIETGFNKNLRKKIEELRKQYNKN